MMRTTYYVYCIISSSSSVCCAIAMAQQLYIFDGAAPCVWQLASQCNNIGCPFYFEDNRLVPLPSVRSVKEQRQTGKWIRFIEYYTFDLFVCSFFVDLINRFTIRYCCKIYKIISFCRSFSLSLCIGTSPLFRNLQSVFILTIHTRYYSTMLQWVRCAHLQ